MKTQEKPNPDRAILVEIDENHEHQRLDNFLTSLCKGVPKSHLFRIIRSGEVRINRKRAQASSKLSMGDVVRIPPLSTSGKTEQKEERLDVQFAASQFLRTANSISVIYEDECLLVVNKPSGLAVHGGSGCSMGLIECLRALRADTHQSLELVHRIDRETSGILIVAKKRSALRLLQEQLRNRTWKKYYQALVIGHWPKDLKRIDLALRKIQASEKEQRVFVDPEGDNASTKFDVTQYYKSEKSEFTLVQAQILTGRTHQIRVHTSASGFPIAGDDRYGIFDKNKEYARLGLKRMFLHAARLVITHPVTNQAVILEAPLAAELQCFLDSMQGFRNQ